MKAIKKKQYIIPIIICVLALAGLVLFYLTHRQRKVLPKSR